MLSIASGSESSPFRVSSASKSGLIFVCDGIAGGVAWAFAMLKKKEGNKVASRGGVALGTAERSGQAPSPLTASTAVQPSNTRTMFIKGVQSTGESVPREKNGRSRQTLPQPSQSVCSGRRKKKSPASAAVSGAQSLHAKSFNDDGHDRHRSRQRGSWGRHGDPASLPGSTPVTYTSSASWLTLRSASSMSVRMSGRS